MFLPCRTNRSFCLVLLALTLTHRAQAGKLDQVGKEARQGTSSSSRSSGSYASSSGTSGSNGGGDAVLIPLLAVTAPWWLPNVTVEARRRDGSAALARFALYPYAHGYQGHLVEALPLTPEEVPNEAIATLDGEARAKEASDGNAVSTLAPPPPPQVLDPQPKSYPVAAVLGVESGIGLTDGIMRLGFTGRVQFPMRLELDSDWSLFQELDNGVKDRLWLGREHLSLRFAESSRVVFRSGIGPQHLCDSAGCVNGIDFTWGFEAFPTKPIVLGLEGDVGNVGNAVALGVRGRVGFLIGPIEISVGYHQRQLGNVPLGGPYLGVSAWF